MGAVDDEPLTAMCPLCRVPAGQECVWRGERRQRFHKCRVGRRPIANSTPLGNSSRQTRPLEEPPDSEKWKRGQHLALHKLRKEHDCAAYPPSRLPLIYERQLAARQLR